MLIESSSRRAPEASPSACGKRTLWLSIALVMIVRLPALLWPAISDDEAIYQATARVINDGGVMYRDAVDHKPPGLAYTYAAMQRITGAVGLGDDGMLAVHALGALAAGITALGLMGVAQAYGLGHMAYLPAILYGLSSTSKSVHDGLAVNGELLMNAPTILAIWAVLKANVRKRGQPVLDLCAGGLLAVAGLFKWQGLAPLAALPFLSVASSQRLSVIRLLGRMACWGLGTSAVLLGANQYFVSCDVGRQFWQWGIAFNRQYLHDGPSMSFAMMRLGLQVVAVVMPSILFYGAGAFGLVRAVQRLEHRRLGLVVWTLLSCMCVAIGGRFFGHYFLQLELPLALFAGFVLQSWASTAKLWRMASYSAAILPAVVFFVLACLPTATRRLLDPMDPDWREVGAQLKRATKSEDTLFIWGNAPLIYHFSERPMATRFSFCNYLTGLSPATPSEYDELFRPKAVDAQVWELLFEDFTRRAPDVILDTAQAGWKSYGKFAMHKFPQLCDFVGTQYVRSGNIAGATLYRRRALDERLESTLSQYR